MEKIPISQGLVTVTHLLGYSNTAITDIDRNSMPGVDIFVPVSPHQAPMSPHRALMSPHLFHDVLRVFHDVLLVVHDVLLVVHDVLLVVHDILQEFNVFL